MRIDVRPVDEHGIVVERDALTSTEEEFVLWDAITSEVLRYGFANRPACLITFEPQRWSLAHDYESRRIRVGRKEYLFTCVDVCTPSMLEEVAQSEDFQRGLLWVTALGPWDEARASDLIAAPSLHWPDAATTTDEIVVCLADGRLVFWSNPRRPLPRVLADVQSLIRRIVGDLNRQD